MIENFIVKEGLNNVLGVDPMDFTLIAKLFKHIGNLENDNDYERFVCTGE